jgi:Zn-dependent peptidase ImmA (M78 family)
MIISSYYPPNLKDSPDYFVANVIAHELGHIIAGHGNKANLPTRENGTIDTIEMERQANDAALPLFSLLFDKELFYYNHLDLSRMENSEKYYNKTA